MPKLALAQLSFANALEKNVAKSLASIEKAAKKGADIIMFPEVQLSPFFPQFEDFDAEPYLLKLDNPIFARFQDTCRENGISAALNVYLCEADERYDASILIGPDGAISGISKMVHITQAPKFYEQNYYTPSREGFRVFTTEIGKIGIVICFDRHYPESFRCCAMQGAEIVLVPTVNMRGEPLELFEWEMRLAAFHNSLYVAMCNRVGREADATYCGLSMLADPGGKLALRCGDSETIALAEYDLQAVAAARTQNQYLKLFDRQAFAMTRGAR